VLVRTDDEVYRVDSVWLGPPRATFPWRARYVSYGVGLLVMIAVMFVQRRIGLGLDFFSVAWALVITVVVTRFLGKKIDYERPLGQVAELFRHEVVGPRRRRSGAGGPVRFAHVRTRRTLPAQRRETPVRSESLRTEVARSETATGTTAAAATAAPAADSAAPRRPYGPPPALPRPAQPRLRDITPVPRRTQAQPVPWATAAQRQKGGRRGRS